MRIANLVGRAHLVVGDGVVDVEELTAGAVGPDPTLVWGRLDELARATIGKATPRAFSPADLGPPSPAPRQVVAIGLNYLAHAAEMGLEAPPMPAAFTKFPSCLSGPNAEVVLRSGTVDWEAEVVAVIGRTAHDVAVADAWDHVAGVTVGQDLSDRSLQGRTGGQFALAKSFPGYGPTGPWVVTADELADRDNLHLTCRLNGDVVQDAWSSDLALSIPELVAQLSRVITLWPGDLIFTGTPSGTGMSRRPPRYLVEGDVLVTEIDGVGAIHNAVVAGNSYLTNPTD